MSSPVACYIAIATDVDPPVVTLQIECVMNDLPDILEDVATSHWRQEILDAVRASWVGLELGIVRSQRQFEVDRTDRHPRRWWWPWKK